jgi:cytoskeleton protein RodZ
MSESTGQLDGGSSEVAQPTDPASAGSMLRNAREAAGLHIAALAVALKVPVKKLEALEADRLDLLPDAVFSRALAASVCRTLKVDPGPVLDKLPQTSMTRLNPVKTGINAPFHASGERRSLFTWRRLSSPIVVLVLALLLGALALVLMPSVEWFSQLVEQSSPASTGAAPVRSIADNNTAPPVTSPVAEPAMDAISSSPAPEARADVASVRSSANPIIGAVVSAPAKSPVTSEASPGVIVLSARASSWVQVTDAAGVVQLSKTMVAGETLTAAGALPLSAVVGRADAMEVQVRGKPFDLAPLTQNNVARFEVR